LARPWRRMMTELLLLSALGLMLSLFLGLLRVLRGPGAADRMLAIQLIGTAGVGMLLLLSVLLDQPALLDVALLLALLAAVAAAAFTGQQKTRRD
jgi:multicomponent Na+:H+ antiporter subunit F